MECDRCGEEVESREEEIDHLLEEHLEELTSHEKDELKRELNQMGSDGEGFSLSTGTIATLVLAVGVLAGMVYLATSGTLQFSSGTGPTGQAVAPVNISSEGEPVLGNSSAPVTVTVYEDFECPVCKRFDQSVMPRLKDEYVETGKVKVVWKDFPLAYVGKHPWSDEAAVAMECVFRKGGDDAFWAVKDRVFANQGELSVSNARSRIAGWAEKEGVSRSSFQACLSNQDPESEVRSDFNEGRTVGVQGTPTVFVEGRKIARPSYPSISRAIENALN